MSTRRTDSRKKLKWLNALSPQGISKLQRKQRSQKSLKAFVQHVSNEGNVQFPFKYLTYKNLSTEDMNNLNDFLSAIENRLLDEIYNLRNIVQNLMPNNNHQRNNYDSYYDNNNVPRYQQNYYRDQERSYENYDNRRNNPYYGDRNYNRADDYNRRQYNDDYLYKEKKYHEHTEKTTQKYLKKNQTTSTERTFFESSRKAPEIVAFRNNNNMLKSLETPREHIFKVTTVDTSTASPSTTQENIDLPTSAKSEYVYYWKLENFPKVFTVDMKNELFSHVFNVKGLFLRIRAVWNQIDGNFMLDTEHLANVDNADKFEIEVSDGLVFKEIADEQLFQYSFAIMDQSKPNHDLISPIYSNTDSETFTIPNSLILLNNYVKNDSLLIKLIISF